MKDLLIIGAGPIGLACAISAQRAGLTATVFDKGALVNSMVGYPTDLEFFSTPELLEIGGHPFTTRNYKPFRAEALEYYRQVAAAEKLDLKLYEPVQEVNGEQGNFELVTPKGRYTGRNVVVATGFFDVPIRLNVPGEDLPHVTHYYKEPYPYVGQRVVVIGAKNSAAKAALDCYRHGAHVTMLVRSSEISPKVKYWVKPDLENRIKEGSIQALFDTHVQEITPEAVHVQTPNGPAQIEADWILAMTGYQPDFSFLTSLGVELDDDPFMTPVHDPETMETNRAGLYLAGVVCGGKKTSVWFIENSRVHADQIAAHVASRSVELEPAVVS